MLDINKLNHSLQAYDDEVFAELEPVLDSIALRSKALASNLRRCFTKIRDNDRYLRAYQGEQVSCQEKNFSEAEFMIFREYVRLLRACTIACGKELSEKYKQLFMDFFNGKRLDLAKQLGETHEAQN